MATFSETVAIKAELQRRLSPNSRTESHGFLSLLSKCAAADGFRMSVQAGHTHYCQPRDNQGPWYQVECGFPTGRVDALMPHIDGDENTDPTSTVYGYVSLDTVAQVFADHGGLLAEQEAA